MEGTNEVTLKFYCTFIPETMIFGHQSSSELVFFFLLIHQVCCGVWRWRVYHLYCYGFEEQELWLSSGVCLGTRLFRVSLLFLKVDLTDDFLR